MKSTYAISPDIIIAIAQVISRCDFRTTVSLYASSANQPWIITVGEAGWRRHLIVEQASIGEEGLDANLAVLSSRESGKSGCAIKTDSIDGRMKLSELIADSYQGVKKVLYHKPAYNADSY